MLRHIKLLPVPIINQPFPILPASKRALSASSALSEKPLPPRIKLNDADITISYLKGTGPGGQKINKTNSAVQLIHNPTGVVIKSQATRSRSQNEKIARSLLADKVEQVLNGDQSRLALKAERERKKKASRMKKSRRKYRELEGKKVEEDGGQEEAGELSEGKEGSELSQTREEEVRSGPGRKGFTQ